MWVWARRFSFRLRYSFGRTSRTAAQTQHEPRRIAEGFSFRAGSTGFWGAVGGVLYLI